MSIGEFRKYKAVLPVMTFAVIGVVGIMMVSAETSSISLEAEQGQRAGNAVQKSDTSASSGQAVQFSSSPTVPETQPTSANTGPRVVSPQHLPPQDISNTSRTFTDVVIDGNIFIRSGGQVTLTNVRVMGTIVVLPQVNGSQIKLHMTDSAAHKGMTVNATDAQGNLYWGSEIPVDMVVSGSWFYYPQGNFANSDHTEALAGFGWPRGAQFLGSAFVQQGPNNGTATATINWHGTDSVFDGCWFLWDGPAAAYYTVYVEGRNNIVRNSWLAATGGYVYPSSSPHAVYVNNRDAVTLAPLTLP